MIFGKEKVHNDVESHDPARVTPGHSGSDRL